LRLPARGVSSPWLKRGVFTPLVVITSLMTRQKSTYHTVDVQPPPPAIVRPVTPTPESPSGIKVVDPAFKHLPGDQADPVKDPFEPDYTPTSDSHNTRTGQGNDRGNRWRFPRWSAGDKDPEASQRPSRNPKLPRGSKDTHFSKPNAPTFQPTTPASQPSWPGFVPGRNLTWEWATATIWVLSALAAAAAIRYYNPYNNPANFVRLPVRFAPSGGGGGRILGK
jgi:hypothetical protein